jgi:hypothetical protein
LLGPEVWALRRILGSPARHAESKGGGQETIKITKKEKI